MKKLTVLLMLLVLTMTILVTGTALAYTPPGQGTDNATDIIIWYGDNITIESANLTGELTITDLTVASEAGAQVIADEITSIWNGFIIFLLAVTISALAFWQKNVFLYLLAAPVNIVYGLNLASDADVASTQWVLGVVVAIIGMFCLFRVVVNELLPMTRRRK